MTTDKQKPVDSGISFYGKAGAVSGIEDDSRDRAMIGFFKAMTVAPEVMLIGRLSNGDVIEVNNRFCDITGYSRDEFVGKKYLDLDIWMDSNDRKRCIELFESRGEVNDFEAFMKLKTGKSAPFLISVHKVLLDGQECFVSTAREISKQKEIQCALDKSQSLYEEAQQIARLGHWELNLKTSHLSWSDEIYRIFEVNREKFGASYEIFLSMVHPEDRDAVDCAFTDSVENKEKYDIVHRLKMRDGRLKYVHERGRTEYDGNGKPLRSVGTVQDITSLKEAEAEKEKVLKQLRQSQRLEAIGTLASGIVHDFNNILFAIMGYAELGLEYAEAGSPVAEKLEGIVKAGLRAKELVSQILTFCRKSSDEKKPVITQLIINESIKFIRASLPAGISVRKRLDSNSLILADSTQIYQVVMNLCTNAAHAMRESGGVLTIELADTDMDKEAVCQFVDMEPGRYLKLTVSDTGHGMTPEIRDCIFDPFFTTKKKGGGTGLGLSVVHGIVKSHSGQIAVYSKPGAGTTFSVFFPVVDRKAEIVQQQSLPIPGGTESILVVDDEEALLKVMTGMLKPFGYNVKAVASPEKAIELFRQDPEGFDLLVSDMNMPGMTGVVLAECLHDINKDLPVIICTGFSDQLISDDDSMGHVNSVLMKPLMKKELGLTVRGVLDSVKTVGRRLDESDT